MDTEQKITARSFAARSFTKVAWDDAAERHLSLIDGLSAQDVAFYHDAVETGHKGLMGVFLGAERIGSIIWGVLNEPQGRVFIVDEMGAECRIGLNLALDTDLMAQQFALKLGANRFRFVTRRDGLFRKLRDRFEVTHVLERSL